MVQSLIQRIRENKLDALYLFINESLRDRNEFDAFFHNLMVVLPNNWSINRVEIGHEFLSRTVVSDQQQAGQVQGNNDNGNNGNQIVNNENDDANKSKQDQLFQWVCSLESLRSLIISDGYIPRKDHGFVDTKALLRHLPRASNLQYLDIQRLKIRITGDGIESNDAELLAESLDTLRDSLEDLRLTAISMCDTRATIQETDGRSQMTQQRYPLDSTIRVCGQMANLQLLAISCANGCECCNSDNGEDSQQVEDDGNRDNIMQDVEGESNENERRPTNFNWHSTTSAKTSCLISREVLLQLCRSSSTLQELALRSMRIDDDTCKTIAKAFDPPCNSKSGRTYLTSSSSLLCSDSEQENNNEFDNNSEDDGDENTNHHSPSFWTSLDLRQNPLIGSQGYEAILSSLERNYDLWCSLMVDNDSFQSRFNALIELNQANRGALIRSPTPGKLAVFLDRLKEDPTALWYFLTIHRDSILQPLIRYLKWKNFIRKKHEKYTEAHRITESGSRSIEQKLQRNIQNPEADKKQTGGAALLLPVPFQPSDRNTVNASFANDDKFNNVGDLQSLEPSAKRPRQSKEGA